MTRHEDLVRAAARFLTQLGGQQWEGRDATEIGHAFRQIASHIAPSAGEPAPTIGCGCEATTFLVAP